MRLRQSSFMRLRFLLLQSTKISRLNLFKKNQAFNANIHPRFIQIPNIDYLKLYIRQKYPHKKQVSLQLYAKSKHVTKPFVSLTSQNLKTRMYDFIRVLVMMALDFGYSKCYKQTITHNMPQHTLCQNHFDLICQKIYIGLRNI